MNRSISYMRDGGVITAWTWWTDPTTGDAYDNTAITAVSLTAYNLATTPATPITNLSAVAKVWDSAVKAWKYDISVADIQAYRHIMLVATPTRDAATPIARTPVRRARWDLDDILERQDEIETKVDALPTAAAIADQVWDEAKAGHVAAGSFGAEVQNITTELANADYGLDALDTHLDDILARLGAFTSSENLKAIIGDLSTTKRLGQILGAFTEAATLKARIDEMRETADGGFDRETDSLEALRDRIDAIDAATNPTTIADAVWDEAVIDHVAAGSFGEEAQSHATPTEVKAQADQALLDYDPPTRAEATSDKDEIIAKVEDVDADLVLHETKRTSMENTLKGEHNSTQSAIAALPTAAAIADAVWDEAIAEHQAAGSTGEALDGASAPTASEVADAVWDEARAAHVAAGSFGQALDAQVSTRASQAALDALNNLSQAEAQAASEAALVAHGAARTADIPTAGEVADQVWDEPVAEHVAAGSFGAEEQSHATPSEVKAQADQALVDHGTARAADVPTAGQVADQVWDEALAEHQSAGSTGEALEDIQSTGGGGPSAAQIADAVWDEPLADHAAAGSTGASLALADDAPTAAAIADQVWDEARSGHATVGTFGEALDEKVSTRASATAMSNHDQEVKALIDALKGAGFDTGTDSLKTIRDAIDTILAASGDDEGHGDFN